MARAIEAYRDERGLMHDTPRAAIIADIAAALGRVGEEGGLSKGVANLILEKRPLIERAFADYDRMVSDDPVMMLREGFEDENVHLISGKDKQRGK